MASNEPHVPPPEQSGQLGDEPIDEPIGADEALRRLEQRLDRVSEAAERLIAEAAERLRVGGEAQADDADDARRRPPAAGWQRPADQARRGREDGAGGGLLGDGDAADLLLAIAGTLRDRIPAELQRRLLDAVREVLLALRALIDWYLERTERRWRSPVEVTDIPIA